MKIDKRVLVGLVVVLAGALIVWRLRKKVAPPMTGPGDTNLYPGIFDGQDATSGQPGLGDINVPNLPAGPAPAPAFVAQGSTPGSGCHCDGGDGCGEGNYVSSTGSQVISNDFMSKALDALLSVGGSPSATPATSPNFYMSAPIDGFLSTNAGVGPDQGKTTYVSNVWGAA